MSSRFAKASVLLTLGALAFVSPMHDGDAGNSCGPGSPDPATGMCNCPGGYAVRGTPGHSRCEATRPPPTTTTKPTTTATTKPTATATTKPATSAVTPGKSVSIPGGSFLMGSSDAEDKDAAPPHLVTLSSFQIDATEVTVSDYEQCVKAGACKPPPPETDTDCNYGAAGRGNHPMNCVSWQEAASYCAAQKKRLPSEAEWEYAARGPKSNVYPWGSAAPTCQHANFTAATAVAGCGQGTSPVATHPLGATSTGVYDLAGNVEEWTLDWAANFTGIPGADPGGPATGTTRVVKGGSWDLSGEGAMHGAHREFQKPEERQNWLGFRCATGPMPIANVLMYKPLAPSGPATPPAPMAPSDPDAMIPIKGGDFTMGDASQKDSAPAHRVSVTAFSIDKYEVTAKKYGQCVAAGACATPAMTEAACTYGKVGKENFPVNCVTWDDARSFCSWAKKRLPTEAEWEFAARGPSQRTYPWGFDAPSCARANYKGCPAAGPMLIGQHGLGVSYFGVNDMSGNVDEWVRDWWGPYASGAQIDPTGPVSGGKRVIRGGNWKEDLGLQAFARWSSDRAATTIGFRCAKTGS